MIPKLANLLSGVFQPVKSTPRPGQQIQFKSSEKSEDGGHGSLGYDASFAPPQDEQNNEDREDPEVSYNQSLNAVPFQPGLTQAILETISKVQDSPTATPASGLGHYQDQNKNPAPAKGGVLDKKAG
jgi:hypothetical protein